MARKG